MAERKKPNPKHRRPPPPPKGNKRALGNKGGGRKSTYHPDDADTAYKLSLLGATDAEIADVLGVNEATVNAWKIKQPEFAQALTQGKIVADSNVAKSLYQRAIGYSHEAVKIFNSDGTPLIVPYTEHYPPDTTAAKHWLNNRRQKDWREKVELSGDQANPVRFIIEGAPTKE